jgi:hypothetical protein
MKHLNYSYVLFCIILLIKTNNGYIFKNSTPSYIRKLTIKYNHQGEEYIPQPPTAEAIQRLQTKGYSYLCSLRALVRENNNETLALIYLNTTNFTNDYVK